MIFSLIAFFVSDAQVMGSLSPFGLALTAAVPIRMSYVSFIGCLAGYLVRGKFFESLSYIAALILVLAVKQLMRPYRKLRDNMLVLSVMTGAISLVSGIIISVASIRHFSFFKGIGSRVGGSNDFVLQIKLQIDIQRKAHSYV